MVDERLKHGAGQKNLKKVKQKCGKIERRKIGRWKKEAPPKITHIYNLAFDTTSVK